MSRIKHDSYKHPDGTQEIENKETNQTQNKICAHFKPLQQPPLQTKDFQNLLKERLKEKEKLTCSKLESAD